MPKCAHAARRRGGVIAFGSQPAVLHCSESKVTQEVLEALRAASAHAMGDVHVSMTVGQASVSAAGIRAALAQQFRRGGAR
jgi:hypothetical protein